MSVIHDLCDAHLKICCLNLLPAEYFFWLLIFALSCTVSSKSGLPPSDVERFIFVVQVAVSLTNISGVSHELMVDSYAYLPSNFQHSLKCNASATLVVFERSYASLEKYVTEQIVGSTKKQPLLETPGEIFEIRKLLPTSLPYDFNIHIMDFQPGEYLNVKEVHYNQHGMLLLEGQCIYRLGDSWMPTYALHLILDHGCIKLNDASAYEEYYALWL
nr:(s)-ureidoglycine aminohydrolase [Quercus suber]